MLIATAHVPRSSAVSAYSRSHARLQRLRRSIQQVLGRGNLDVHFAVALQDVRVLRRDGCGPR